MTDFFTLFALFVASPLFFILIAGTVILYVAAKIIHAVRGA